MFLNCELSKTRRNGNPKVGENHIFLCLRRFPTQKSACLQRVKAISIAPTKDPRSNLKYFCCFDDIANGLSYVDRVQHVLMCVGMKLPTEADFVFCFINQKAWRTSRCFWPPMLDAKYRLSYQHPFSLCTENYLEEMVLKWNANCVKFRLETGQPQIHRNWTKAQRDSWTLVECQNLVRYHGGCGPERHGTFACRSLIPLSNNGVLRMLLRMLSA